ncbi:MAG: hypothetical protein CMB80_05310, partial [Flammeovirgaceae bacterium]|nr:hypothetical protein [Flammeovirgaceae bacterium]
MKIYNKIIIEWNDETQSYDKVVYEDSYEYDGELMLARDGCPHAELDGIDHEWVIIGTGETAQCWLKKNLETGIYSDGSGAISYGESNTEWSNFNDSGTGAYTWNPGLDPEETGYPDWGGYLYNWYAVDAGGICPVDVYVDAEDQWHVPTHPEWSQLERYICEFYVGSTAADCLAAFPDDYSVTGSTGTTEGRALKENDPGFVHWQDSTNNDNIGTDDAGFTVLPAGERGIGVDFQNLNTVGSFWTATSSGNYTGKAWYRKLSYIQNNIYRHEGYQGTQGHGYSVRCVTAPIDIWDITVTANQSDVGNRVLDPDDIAVESWSDYRPAGTNVTVTAAPVTGYAFVNWTNDSGNEVSLTNPYEFELTADRILFANFNAIPVPTTEDVVTDEDVPVDVTLTASDVDTDDEDLTFAILTAPTHGTFSGDLPNLIYTPTLNYNGTDSFQYTVWDGYTTAVASVTITVTAVLDEITITSPTSDEEMETDEDVDVSYQIEWTYTGPGD